MACCAAVLCFDNFANRKPEILHAEEFCLHFLGFDFVESLTCYRAFVSLAATASNSTKLFWSRSKEKERKINLLVTGPTLCKPYTSIY